MEVGGIRGSGRGKSTSVSLHLNLAAIDRKLPSSINIDCNVVPYVDHDDSLYLSSYYILRGMEDFTHLQGCGGWPNSTARGQ